jgi:RNA polymerase sigma factor (sigma-70 family)
MATGQLNGVVRHLRRIARAPDLGSRSDGQLLEQFLLHQDEAAFEVLVRRWGPMVLGVCRRVLGDRHDAEDAFQATFLVLLRKARSLTRPELLGNWLYGVAYYTAQNARASRARRRAAERQVSAMPAPTASDREIASDLLPLLDAELSRLPEKYRAPLVLCELHGKSRKEAARLLGCAEGTLSSRLARGRDLLRRRLAKRGLALSAAALTGALTPAPAPAALTANTVKAATAIAAGQVAAGVSPAVIALTEGVLKAMFLTKLKIVSAVCIVAGLLVGGAGLLTCQALAGKPAAPAKTGAAAEADKQEGKKEKGPSVQGILQAVDAGKNSITVTVPVEGTKQTRDQKFDLAADVKVLINNALSKNDALPTGKLTDLSEGTGVQLELSPDKKAVVAITARGPKLQGHVKSVDAARNALTVTVKENKGTAEKTVELAKGGRVLLNDGLKKGDPDKEGKLSDLAEGAPVSLQLSVDRKSALEVRVHGASVKGRVKGVDVGNNTITLTLKEDAQIVDKTFSVDKNVRMDGKLSDLTADTPVVLQMSVFDQKKVVAIHVLDKNNKDKE